MEKFPLISNIPLHIRTNPPWFAQMLSRTRITALLLLLPLLTQCGTVTAPTTNVVTGPFDSRGNYIEEWVHTPEKWHRPSTPATRPRPTHLIAKRESQRRPEPQPQIAVVETRPVSPTTSSPVVSAPKPKPKPVVVKPKPKLVKYTVRKGDNLSRIASRHGVTLAALRRANGISGDLIRPGQSLTIPR